MNAVSSYPLFLSVVVTMPTELNLANVLLGSTANGPGRRDVFWVAGCSLKCPGCINPHFLDANAGTLVAVESILELINRRRDAVEGLTFSGGEPTEQAEALTRVALHAQSLGLSVVMFTGYTLERCRRDSVRASLLRACDLVIAGPYLQHLQSKPSALIGSSNQRIHFLSERYSPADLENIPDLELMIQDGRWTMTGVPG